MADLKVLGDETAETLLKAVKAEASKATDSSTLLNLAQAYSLIVSAEVTAELVEGE
ncbi:MAG: hypothetical protein ACXWZL_00070 [Mycobacterium sp.]